jgi:transposase
MFNMMKKFKEYLPNQPFLFPPSLNDWLPKDHPAHFIDEVVECLDLRAIYNDYGIKGQPPYNPAMMVKVFLYALSKGIQSSRKIEKALYDDVALRYLSGNQQPDHWTISEFRRRHHRALGDLFIQSIKLAQKAGLVKLNHVSVDGTKIKANASKHSAMSYAHMQTEEVRLSQEIERLFKEMARNDKEEDRLYGQRRGDELPEQLSTVEKRLEAIKKAKAELEADARQKQQEQLQKEQRQKEQDAKPRKKKRIRKRNKKQIAGEPDPKAQKNFTDPESKIMLSSDKAFIQGYNAQATVDAKHQIIVAADVTDQPNDKNQLIDQIDQAKENTGSYPREASADAGYYSEDNVRYVMQKQIDVYIPPEKIKHSEWRDMKFTFRGRIPCDISIKDLMRRKLRTKYGRKKYKLRQQTVEPVFGVIKEQFGLRQFLLRGRAKVRSMWRLTCAIFNMMKLYRAKVDLKALTATA